MKPRINKGGRPYALKPDKQTLKIIRGLGKIQATARECATVLGVSDPTFIIFKKTHREAREAYEEGLVVGQASLRRRRLKMAKKSTVSEVYPIANLFGQADKA